MSAKVAELAVRSIAPISSAVLSRVGRPAIIAALSSSSSSSIEASAPYKTEHLIWERGFGMKLAASLAACASIAWVASQSNEAWMLGLRLQSGVSHRLMQLAHRLEWWSALGLLSSSCCVLQLLLNTLSVGCAGFNTFLGPVRPQMMAMTLSLQATMWHSTITGRASSRVLSAVAASVLTAVLTLLPELLHLHIHRRRLVESRASEPVLSLSVGGMGCTACSTKVKGALEAVEGVDFCEVLFEEGAARVHLAAAADEPTVASAVLKDCEEAIRGAGFAPSAAASSGE